VGLFSSNISVLVDIESVPCLLKVSFHVSWNLGSLQFVGSFKNDSGSFRGGRFHKDLLAVLDTVMVFTFNGVLREDLIHNFILVSSIEIMNGDLLFNLESVNIVIVDDGKPE
jgi:hypothetical protein